MNTSSYPVIFIVGPTCTGKTDLGFYLTKKFQGKMINADSLQFYKHMDIGTSKPKTSQLKSDSHFLFSHVNPPHVYTVGEFHRDSRELLKKILPHQACFVVGGSGFYFQALEKGCYPIQKVSSSMREQLLQEIQEGGLGLLYDELVEKDSDYAREIHPHDKYRIIRSLGFIREEGTKMSEVKKSFKQDLLPYKIIKIGLTGSSEVLKERVLLRVKNMLALGFVEEVKNLCHQGWGDFPPLQSVGYREILLFLKGKIKEEDLCDQIVQRTMHLVKKQKTWFKRDKSIRWYDCHVDFDEIYQDLNKFVLQ